MANRILKKSFAPFIQWLLAISLFGSTAAAQNCNLFGDSSNRFSPLGRITGKGRRVTPSWTKDSEEKFRVQIENIKMLTAGLKSRFGSQKLADLIEALSKAIDLHPEKEIDNYNHNFRTPIQEAIALIRELPEAYRIQIPNELLSALGLPRIPVKVTTTHQENANDEGLDVRNILAESTPLADRLPEGRDLPLPSDVLTIGSEMIERVVTLVQFENLLLAVKHSAPLLDSRSLLIEFAPRNRDAILDSIEPRLSLEETLQKTRTEIFSIVGELGPMANNELRIQYASAIENLQKTRFRISMALMRFLEERSLPPVLHRARYIITSKIKNKTPEGIRWLKRLGVLGETETFDPDKVQAYEDEARTLLLNPIHEIRAMLAKLENWREASAATAIRNTSPSRRFDDRDGSRALWEGDVSRNRDQDGLYNPDEPTSLNKADQRAVRRLFPQRSKQRKIYQIFATYLAELGALNALEDHVDLIISTQEITPEKVQGLITILGFIAPGRKPIQDLLYNHPETFLQWAMVDHAAKGIQESPLFLSLGTNDSWALHRDELMKALKSSPPWVNQ